METDKNYFVVGIFVIGVIVAGFLFTLWLTSFGQGSMVQYQIRFAESVGGLNEGSVVKYHGVNVGNVKTIAIDPQDVNLSRVNIDVLESAPIKASTVASLKFLGISGDVYVELTGGSADEPNLADVATQSPPEIKSERSGLSVVMDRLPQIAEKADNLFEKLNHTADQVNKMFSDKNVKAVNGVVKNLSSRYGTKEETKEPKDNSPPHYPN